MSSPIQASLDPVPETTEAWGPAAIQQRRLARKTHSDLLAPQRDGWIRSNAYFYNRLKRLLRFLIEPGKRVLEVRCQTGHLLAAVDPAQGVGVEVSDKLVNVASKNFPKLSFVKGEPEDVELNQKFDYVMLSHVFDTVDVLQTLESIQNHCTDQTRLLVINYNPLWQGLLELGGRLGLRAPFLEPNWVAEPDLYGFLRLAGFLPLHTHRILLCPKNIPVVSWLLNDVIGRLPGFRHLCMMQVIVARPAPAPRLAQDFTVSVIVPCRNERGNVEAAVDRIPRMGAGTEIIFCDDKSTDGTADEVRRMQALHPGKNIRLVNGPGICKAENVWTGFRAATGDMLMILDADLTVMPEELPLFMRSLAEGKGEFINGSRLVYPMPKAAMKLTNRIGNKVFGAIFSYLLDQRIKDTLCGTKVLWRSDWERVEKRLGTWGIKDLWGDYELLFGAARLQLEIVDMPVHYQERVYGVTKMAKVFSNGVRMLGICWGAWRRLHG